MDESQSGGETARNAARMPPARFLRTARGGREWAGWVVLAVGAVLSVLGWYGVSGERYAEQQIPYLASSTVPGAALIVAGAVLVALRPGGGRSGGGFSEGDLTDRRVARLYELLVEPADGTADDGAGTADAGGAGGARGATGEAGEEGWLAVPEGAHYHRPQCPLVAGKARAAAVDEEAIRARGLTPCPLCEPAAQGPPGTPGASGTPSPSDPPTGPGRPTRPGEPAPPTG